MVVSVDSFEQARWFHRGRLRPVRLIVLHDMESPENLTTAEDVGRYFATTDRKGSSHVGVDADSTVRYVDDGDTAFGAAGANADGWHIEQAGRARQTREEWLDPYSRAVIRRAATAGREAAAVFGVPLRQLTVAEVADGVTKGFTDHATVSTAFPDVSTGHTDPGPDYPWDVFLADLASAPAAGAHLRHQLLDQEDDMPDQPHSPALVTDPHDGAAFAFVRGTDRKLYASVNGGQLTQNLGGQLLSWPRVGVLVDGIVVACMGVDGHGYVRRRKQGAWEPDWVKIGGTWDTAAAAAALAVP